MVDTEVTASQGPIVAMAVIVVEPLEAGFSLPAESYCWSDAGQPGYDHAYPSLSAGVFHTLLLKLLFRSGAYLSEPGQQARQLHTRKIIRMSVLRLAPRFNVMVLRYH